jgi:DNA-binding transcriptional MerR regulator
MWISRAAREAGVNQQTLRYYERRGLLPRPARRGAYREYPAEAVQIVRFVKRAQELGFSLDEIDELLRLRAVSAADRPRVRAMAAQKLADIDVRLRHLTSMRRALASLVASCQKGGTPCCPILESLSALAAPRAAKGGPRG